MHKIKLPEISLAAQKEQLFSTILSLVENTFFADGSPTASFRATLFTNWRSRSNNNNKTQLINKGPSCTHSSCHADAASKLRNIDLPQSSRNKRTCHFHRSF